MGAGSCVGECVLHLHFFQCGACICIRTAPVGILPWMAANMEWRGEEADILSDPLTIQSTCWFARSIALCFEQDEDFVEQLASQMDALRGRELPGFMSAQSFYMFMAQYVEAWRDPARVAATEVRGRGDFQRQIFLSRAAFFLYQFLSAVSF